MRWGCIPGRWKVFASDIDTEVLRKSEKRYLSPSEPERYRRSSYNVIFFMRGWGRMKDRCACVRNWPIMLNFLR